MNPAARLLAVGVASLALLTGCGFSGGAGGFVAGDGTITLLPAAQRQSVGTVAGDTFTKAGASGHLDLASLRGKVVVVNVWGSWCAPCRAEAPRLEAAYENLAKTYGSQIAFVGINTRDQSIDNAIAFDRTFNVSYPSIYDFDGSSLLAFRGRITPAAIPSTIVVDKDGRIAASVIGEVTSAITLENVVQDVVTGKTHVS